VTRKDPETTVTHDGTSPEATVAHEGGSPETLPGGSPQAESDATATVSRIPDVPTLRHRDDVDGCGCVRCQRVDYDVARRSAADAVVRSVGIVRRHPSLLLAFLVVGIVAIALDRTVGAVPAAVVGFLGVVFGRGYVGLVAAETARSDRADHPDRSDHPDRAGRLDRSGSLESVSTDGTRSADAGTTLGRLRRVAVVTRRLPATLVGGAFLTAALICIVVVATAVASPATSSVFTTLGLAEFTSPADVALLVCTVAVLLAVLVKSCFLPEACFVGGYGPLEGLRASWRLTAVHRGKAIALTGGLLALFAVTALLDARFGDPSRPVVLSVTLRGTTVPLRSLGLSTAGPVRLLFDVVLSTVYYAVFAHAYLGALFEDGMK